MEKVITCNLNVIIIKMGKKQKSKKQNKIKTKTNNK